MAVGLFGIQRASDELIANMEGFYSYSASRSTTPGAMTRLNLSTLLTYNYIPSGDQDYINSTENLLEGVLTLQLPATIFNQVGYYNILIRPQIILSIIVDCSSLQNLPNIIGIVIDGTKINSSYSADNALQGFKVEYLDVTTGNKVRNLVRYVTNSYTVAPISTNVSTTNQKSIQYQINSSGSLIFLALTPSASSGIKPNSIPYQGTINQQIILSPTSFNPILIEVEMVSDDITSLAAKLLGNSIKNSSTGEYTLLDSQTDEILIQYNLYEIKATPDSTTDLYEIRQENTNVDATQTITNISQQYNLQL